MDEMKNFGLKPKDSSFSRKRPLNFGLKFKESPLEINAQTEFPDSSAVRFTCPNDGEIAQSDVVFLCNNCSRDQLVYKNGIYMCPSCLKPGENFQCMLCDSKEVKMKELKK